MTTDASVRLPSSLVTTVTAAVIAGVGYAGVQFFDMQKEMLNQSGQVQKDIAVLQSEIRQVRSDVDIIIKLKLEDRNSKKELTASKENQDGSSVYR